MLVGDVFLGAACIAYYGAFPGSFRQELLMGWVEQCKQLGIPVSHDCTLQGVLASPVQVSSWFNHFQLCIPLYILLCIQQIWCCLAKPSQLSAPHSLPALVDTWMLASHTAKRGSWCIHMC